MPKKESRNMKEFVEEFAGISREWSSNFFRNFDKSGSKIFCLSVIHWSFSDAYDEFCTRVAHRALGQCVGITMQFGYSGIWRRWLRRLRQAAYVFFLSKNLRGKSSINFTFMNRLESISIHFLITNSITSTTLQILTGNAVIEITSESLIIRHRDIEYFRYWTFGHPEYKPF